MINNQYYSDLEKENVIITYSRYPIAFQKGKAAYLWDVEGKKYLDFLSGLAVTNFGHAHPVITKAVQKQAAILIHTSNLFEIPGQIKAAGLISELSFPGRTFFCNSGTEANEAALKLARLRGNTLAKGKNTVLSLTDSFHGRTTGSIKLTGQQKYQEGFEPLISGIKYVTRNDIDSLESAFSDDVCAIFLEGIQGESGIHVLTDSFVNKTVELCEKYDALLIFDEVQTGMGRTGKYFSYQHFGITPDVITLAKGISNGLPTGAMHVQTKHKEIFKPGNHASTFGGNPLCMAAACAVMELLKKKETMLHIQKMSELLFARLEEVKNLIPGLISEIRGKGLMIAIGLNVDAKEINGKLLKNRVITNAIGNNTLRILPPFIITAKDVDNFIMSLLDVLKNN